MSEDPQIPKEDLQKILQILLNHVCEQRGDSFPLEEDFFWSVPTSDVYNVYEDPGELSIGSLVDSWGNLEKMLAGDKPVTGFGLVWLADVLRAIGHKNLS